MRINFKIWGMFSIWNRASTWGFTVTAIEYSCIHGLVSLCLSWRRRSLSWTRLLTQRKHWHASWHSEYRNSYGLRQKLGQTPNTRTGAEASTFHQFQDWSRLLTLVPDWGKSLPLIQRLKLAETGWNWLQTLVLGLRQVPTISLGLKSAPRTGTGPEASTYHWCQLWSQLLTLVQRQGFLVLSTWMEVSSNSNSRTNASS